MRDEVLRNERREVVGMRVSFQAVAWNIPEDVVRPNSAPRR
jgi:hypothetical protein